MKTPYTDEEVEQLNDLYSNHYFIFGISHCMNVLKKELGFSDVHNVITCLRKESNKVSKEKWSEYEKNYEGSTLFDKLSLKMSENETNK